jgi:hypothetical protein
MKAKSIFSLMPLIQLIKRRFIMVSKKAIYNLIPKNIIHGAYKGGVGIKGN